MQPSAHSSSSGTIAIVGGGIGACLTGLACQRQGWTVIRFEPAPDGAPPDAAETGMLSAADGIEEQQPDLITLTLFAREQWPVWEQTLSGSFLDAGGGGTILAHPRDAAAMEALHAAIDRDVDVSDEIIRINRTALSEREPALAGRFSGGLVLTEDRCLDPRRLMAALDGGLSEAGIRRIPMTGATLPQPHSVVHDGTTMPFDWVLDWRDPLPPGAPVMRRDLLILEAPRVILHHPVRLMHPGHPLYILPRGEGRYDIAAIQSRTPPGSGLRARILMELLSAAGTVHPGFTDATVPGTASVRVAIRPGGLPSIEPGDGLLTVTGTNAYAMASAPAIADIITHFITKGETHPLADGIMKSWQL